MKYYIQFQVESSGVAFKNGELVADAKFPMDLVGTDGVSKVDGRLGLDSMVQIGYEAMEKLLHIHVIIGFKIVKAKSFREEGFIVFDSLKNPNGVYLN